MWWPTPQGIRGWKCSTCEVIWYGEPECWSCGTLFGLDVAWIERTPKPQPAIECPDPDDFLSLLP